MPRVGKSLKISLQQCLSLIGHLHWRSYEPGCLAAACPLKAKKKKSIKGKSVGPIIGAAAAASPRRKVKVISEVVAALHQGVPGQMTWLEDPPPWLKPSLRRA